jgi:hypothetical protein
MNATVYPDVMAVCDRRDSDAQVKQKLCGSSIAVYGFARSEREAFYARK